MGKGMTAETAARRDDPLCLSININTRKRRVKIAPLTTQNHNRIPTAVRAQEYKVADQLKYNSTN